MSELEFNSDEIFGALRNGYTNGAVTTYTASNSQRVSVPPVVRVPPSNIPAERCLLGALILSGELLSRVRELISPSTFYIDIHSTIYQAILKLADEGRPIDAVVVADRLETSGKLADIGGAEYLFQLMEAAGIADYAVTHADIIRRLKHERDFQNCLRSISDKLDNKSASLDELIAETHSMFQTMSENIAVDTKPKFAVMTAEELDAADIRTEFLVDGILVKGQPSILAAVKKCLKTNIGIDLTMSLGSASRFLNKFNVPRAVRVAMMSGESGGSTIQETMRRITRSKPWINPIDYENVYFSFDLPRLGRPETKRDLIKFIGDLALEVLIIDPAYLCLDLGDDAGNLFKVGPKLMELTEVMAETGSTIILIHHCKKSTNDPYAIPELENISWSGFQEHARQWILLNRRERYDPENEGTHKLWLSVGGSAGHSGCWAVDIEEGSYKDNGGRRWDVSVQSASSAIGESIEARNAAKEEEKRAKRAKQVSGDAEILFALILKRPEGDTKRGYRDSSSLSGTRSAAAFDWLVSEGRLEPCEVVKNKTKHPGFRPVTKQVGLTGTDRDSNGTNPTRPDDEHGLGFLPVRGNPNPTHRDNDATLFGNAAESRPVDFSEATF